MTSLTTVVVLTLASTTSLNASTRTNVDDLLPPRMSPAITAVDGKLFVWGGHRRPTGTNRGVPRVRVDGVLLAADGTNGESLPPAPFRHPVYRPLAVTSGHRVLVTGLACVSLRDEDGGDFVCTPGNVVGAEFDARTRRWRRIEIPEVVGDLKPLGTSSEGDLIFGPVLAAPWLGQPLFWRYDPPRRRWSELPRPGVTGHACLTGDTVVVLATQYSHLGQIVATNPALTLAPGEVVGGSADDGYVNPSILTLDTVDASAEWRQSEVATGIAFGNFDPTLACAGSYALVGATVPREPVVFDVVAGTWRASTALRDRFVSRDAIWTARGLLNLLGDDSFVYHPETDTVDDLVGGPALSPLGSVTTVGRAVALYQPVVTTARRPQPVSAAVVRYVPKVDRSE